MHTQYQLDVFLNQKRVCFKHFDSICFLHSWLFCRKHQLRYHRTKMWIRWWKNEADVWYLNSTVIVYCYSQQSKENSKTMFVIASKKADLEFEKKNVRRLALMFVSQKIRRRYEERLNIVMSRSGQRCDCRKSKKKIIFLLVRILLIENEANVCISQIWLFLIIKCLWKFSIVCKRVFSRTAVKFLRPRNCYFTNRQLKSAMWTSFWFFNTESCRALFLLLNFAWSRIMSTRIERRKMFSYNRWLETRCEKNEKKVM